MCAYVCEQLPSLLPIIARMMVLHSFLDVSDTSHFSLQNLPYGVFTCKAGAKRRIGVALGSHVIDLAALSEAGLFSGPHLQKSTCFNEASWHSLGFR